VTPGNDLSIYEGNAQRWWDPEDRFFRSLRSVGDFHLRLLERRWGAALAGARVAELGCGGGYVALALAERGARVVGLDLSPASLRAARGEARRRGLAGAFVRADLYRCPLTPGSFDLVVLPDVLEHLEEPARALAEASRLLRPGGRLFLSTFDRTWFGRLAVVTLAEGLGLVPRGTHDARWFVRPEEVREYGRRAGLTLEVLLWERPALLRTLRTWTIQLEEARRGHGYSAFFVKDPPARRRSA